ncbi:alpha/beta fold hydrolase [Arthrobacter agilis]|uniref:alpha/beta fold hydrolase n=1 Tax=Arthrobacter agilis TaxID=37921 RepID=UPI002786FCC1|nr:alpha/beta hydrolase [Arthrobacter agilis]MDQ0736891.1 pimeloyl-ACP methyl ester carboxylesterase [Arthrobacter agilis]
MAQLPAPQQVTRIATRLGALHVRTIGDGRTTVLWPSMFVDGTTWDPLVAHLGTGRRYVLVDGPGLGLSDPLTQSTDIAGAADAARDLLAGLGVTEPVDWVGNAFGDHVGYKLAAEPGVLRSLVAISAPAEPIPAALRAKINVLLPLLRLAGPGGPVRGAVIGAMLTDASARDEDIRRIVVESLERPTRRSLTTAIRSFILDRRDVSAELGAIDVPCLYVASDDRGDWTPEAAARAAARTPRATAVTVPRARTLIPLEQPERVAEQLLGFWADLDDAHRAP